MAVEAWLIDESDEDQRLHHHRDPKEYVPMSKLEDIGILYWHLDPKNYENDEELKKIRETRGYSYMDFLELGPGKVENYEEKLKCFFREHIHADEEIRYCLEGSGYFDVRGKDDQWIRIWIKEGDLIVLPAGIYHRFTLDTSNYVKLMRLFVGEPVWTAYNRPQEEHPARKGYVKSFFDNQELLWRHSNLHMQHKRILFLVLSCREVDNVPLPPVQIRTSYNMWKPGPTMVNKLGAEMLFI